MNLYNLERDMFWSDNSDPIDWSANTDLAASPALVGNSGVVGTRHSFVQSTVGSITSGTGVQCKSVGCLILPPPDGDNTPYRVKGTVVGQEACLWSYGYWTGSGVERRRDVGAGFFVDEAVCIRPLADTDANYGDPLIFYVSALRNGASSVLASLSVQRMLSKPEQYASASS